MKHTTLVQFVALAIMMLVISAASEPKPSAQTKLNQPPMTKNQTVTSFDPATSQERRTPAQTQPARNESEIIKQTRAYEASLRELAEKAQQIVQRMPERPDDLAHNFGDLREVLVAARTNLTALLERKAQIDAQAESVLQSAADLRQSFADLSKKIETHLQGLRQKETDNPKGLEAAAKAMSGIRELACAVRMRLALCVNWCLKLTSRARSFLLSLRSIPKSSISRLRLAIYTKKGSANPQATPQSSKD